MSSHKASQHLILTLLNVHKEQSDNAVTKAHVSLNIIEASL